MHYRPAFGTGFVVHLVQLWFIYPVLAIVRQIQIYQFCYTDFFTQVKHRQSILSGIVLPYHITVIYPSYTLDMFRVLIQLALSH